ncbi:hypothetical protein HK405_002352, partial [Cladochytrium tenue]
GFDTNFNYIREKDEHQMHDNWLEGVTVDEVKKAKAARDRLEARAKAMDDADERLDENQVYLGLLRHLNQRESIAAAIKRLGASSKVPAWKKKKMNKSKDQGSMDAEESSEAAAARKKTLDEIISLSDKLTSVGHYDTMQETYESIVRKLRLAQVL